MQKLSELQVGQKGYIVKVHGYGGFRKRIVEMGFIKGQVVEVVNNAPLKDPITYSIMGYEVSLRRSVAEQIDVILPEDAERELAESNFLGTLTEDDFRRVALEKQRKINVALVGNPNAGKSTLFNALTGMHVKVGNYGGVTVDIKTGKLEYKGYDFHFSDLPGTYSISAFSPEERLVRKHLVEQKPDVVLNVVDSGNLERNLYLTTQLIDMNLRSIIAMNFYDELKQRGDSLDIDALGKLIGIPIVPTSALKNEGLEDLLDSIIKLYEGSDIIDRDGRLIPAVKDDALIEKYLHLVELEHRHDKKSGKADLVGKKHLHEIVRHVHINYGAVIEHSIQRLKQEFAKNDELHHDFTPRYIAIQLLQYDKDIEGFVARYANYSQIIKIRDEEAAKIEAELKTSSQNAIMDAKYGFIAGALKETYEPKKEKPTFTPTSRIDRIITNRYLAYPIFALVIYMMFFLTFTLGQYPMNWIESGVAWLGEWVGGAMNDGILKDLIKNALIGGVGSVLVFLPNILILYFCMTLLDASGYMARAAFIMDKLMHKIGLHGKSFIPMMMGFGCTVPAIMATRIIENRNSRIITILVTSFMSCSARLPVYILFVGTFFPQNQALAMFLIYFAGIVFAGIFAKIFKKFMLKRDDTPFVMELPKYRLPQMRYVLRDTWEKGSQYLRKIGTTILVGSIIIWALAYFPHTEGQSAEQQMEGSYLASVGKAAEPIMQPLGFDWKISVGIITGLVAKEMVVSTLGVLYNVDEESLDSSLPAKLKAATYADGTPIYTTASVVAMLLFVLLYFPCIATIATIRNETGSWLWAGFVAFYTTALAWLMAFVAFQTISRGVVQETAVALIILACLIFILYRLLNKNKKPQCSGCSGCSVGKR